MDKQFGEYSNKTDLLQSCSNQNGPIDVTCAIIMQNQKVLCVQRSKHMESPLKWEFPGGKVEANESPEECLVREIQEELGLTIEILEKLPNNVHSYSEKLTINLLPYLCRIQTGNIFLKEHRQGKWMERNRLLDLDWAEADLPVVKNFLNR